MLDGYSVLIRRIGLASAFLAASALIAVLPAYAAHHDDKTAKAMHRQTLRLRGVTHHLRLYRLTGRYPLPDPYHPNGRLLDSGSAVYFVLTDSVTPALSQGKVRPQRGPARGKSRILFVVYGLINAPGLSYPHPIYSADFVPHVGTNNIYIVMEKSISNDVQFFVFKASLKKSLGEFPFAFTAKNFARWPKALVAISDHKEGLKKGFCGIARIHVFLKGASIFIYGLREDPKCPPVYVKYRITKGTWIDITSTREIKTINKLVQAEKINPKFHH